MLGLGQLKHSLIVINAELRRHTLQGLLEIFDLLRPNLNLWQLHVKDGLAETLIHLAWTATWLLIGC